MHRKWKRSLAMVLCASMLFMDSAGISAGSILKEGQGTETIQTEVETESGENPEKPKEPPAGTETAEETPETEAGTETPPETGETPGTETGTETPQETEAALETETGNTENPEGLKPVPEPESTENPGETEKAPEGTERAELSPGKEKTGKKADKEAFQRAIFQDDTDYIEVSTLDELIKAASETEKDAAPQYVFTLGDKTAEVSGELIEMPGPCKESSGEITVPGEVFSGDSSLDEKTATSGEISLQNLEEATDYTVNVSEDTVTLAGPFAAKRLVVTGDINFSPILGAESIIKGFGGINILNFETEEKTKKACELLNGAGILAEPDTLMETSALTARENGAESKEDEETKEQEDAGEGAEVTAAVIDSGYDMGRATERIVSAADVTGKGNVNDDMGHGTAMADIILNHTPKAVKAMPIKVTDEAGRTSALKMYLGLMYAIEHEADLINISMTAYKSAQASFVEGAIGEAEKRGIPVIVSAGNYGEDVKDYSPANAAHAIAVSAVNKDKARDAYSNYGDIDYCAYGSMEVNGTKYQGTSVSAAIVTAAAASAFSFHRKLDKAGLMETLDQAAEDLGEEGADIYFGRGFLSLESIKPEEEENKVPEKSELLTCDFKSLSDEELNALIEAASERDAKRFLDGLTDADRKGVLSRKDSYYNREYTAVVADIDPGTKTVSAEEKRFRGTFYEYLCSEFFADYSVQADNKDNEDEKDFAQRINFDNAGGHVFLKADNQPGNGKLFIQSVGAVTDSNTTLKVSGTNGGGLNFKDIKIESATAYEAVVKGIKVTKGSHTKVSGTDSVVPECSEVVNKFGSSGFEGYGTPDCGSTFTTKFKISDADEECSQVNKARTYYFKIAGQGSTEWTDDGAATAGTCLVKGKQKQVKKCKKCNVVVDTKEVETSYGPHKIDEVNWRYEGNGDYPVDGCRYHACTVCNGEHDDEIGPHIFGHQYRYSLSRCFENPDGSYVAWTTLHDQPYDPGSYVDGFAYYETPDSDFVTTIFPGFYSGTRATANRVKVPRKTYSVVYKENGATSGSVNTQYGIRCGAYFNISGNGYVRPGYDFTGWNTNPDGSGDPYSPGQSVSDLIKVNGAAVMLYAQWKPAIFKITLDHQSGTSPTKAIYQKYTVGYFGENDPEASGERIDKVTVPKRLGYDFNGYYTKKNGGGKEIINEKGKITAPNTQFTANATVYAYWTQQVYTMELDSSMEGTEAEKKGTGVLYEWFSNGFYKKYKDKKVSEELKDKTIETPLMRKDDGEIEKLTDGKVKKRRYFFDGYFDKNKKIINGEGDNPEGLAGYVLVGPDYYTDDNTTDRKVTLKASYIPQRILYYHPNFSDKMQDIGMTEEMILVPEHIWKNPSEEVTLAGPRDDAKITDEGYAKLCQFKGWNTKPDGTGEWVTDLKVRDDTKDLALYAQWEIKFHLAYIGNSQTRGIDFMDNNGEEGYTVEKDAALTMSAKDDEEGYTFFRKKDNNSFTNQEGETITQEVDCSVAGWSFQKDNKKETMYGTKEEVLMSELLLSAKKEGDLSGAEVISYGAANPDFGSHDAEPEQGMHGHPGSLLGFFPENKGKGLINLLKGAQEDAFQTPVINLYAVWDKGPVIDAEEEIYFTLNEAKRGDITEEELLNYAAAWDKELTGITPGGYLKEGEDKENHTEFTVCDYDHRQFEALEHNAMITVMYRAADSIGNVTYKQSKVYIVDTASRRDTEAHTRENARAYLRFISAEYLWTLDKDSLWNTDPVRHQMLLEALDPDTPPQYRMVYTHQDILDAKEGYDLPAEEFWEKHVEPFIVERN